MITASKKIFLFYTKGMQGVKPVGKTHPGRGQASALLRAVL
jgi:hypothetical protein